MVSNRILVVDDEKEILISCSKILRDKGYSVTTTTDGAEAIEILKKDPYDLLLVDLKLPGKDGIEILQMAREIDPNLMAIIFTAYATIETAVRAIKKGAFDYIPKPFSAEQLGIAVDRALEHKRLVKENISLREQIAESFKFENIVGTSTAMQLVFETIKKVAKTDANVLITGESGTGKELIARCIHANSNRKDRPFVAVDCAALPENLLESELFGHEKGAFTGADKTKRGLLELAHQGTLFLDEIGELASQLQAKLLRTIQEREFRRLGGERLISVDIRIISSTNRDLKAAVEKGAFREDLYFRLNVVEINLPPLRSRLGDIPLLANYFLGKYSKAYQKSVDKISPEAMKTLEAYPWPGNVRELQNVIERAVALAEDNVIKVYDLPDYIKERSIFELSQTSSDLSFKAAREKWLESMGRTYLINLLKRNKGNISQAAREAQISRKTLYRLLEKFEIDVDKL